MKIPKNCLLLSLLALVGALLVGCGDDEKYEYPITGSIECPMRDDGETGLFRFVGECGYKITNGMKRCPRCNTSVKYIKALEKEFHIGVTKGEDLDEIQDRLDSINVPK